ncbi:clostripain-related cysteine peptidase [Olivibacter sitiensis]|uniref:clostripain-related cysteine peptidase n=1 Tax=Olivibacter sitiensis TaxID=376470 RepID=UPI000485DDF2|nr:clostripain-related cysteine peptidase [Olivibacter sitiensis]
MNKWLSCLALLFLLFLSCYKEDELLPGKTSENTVLIYMAANNDLYFDAEEDLEEILQSKIPDNGNLLVYISGPSYSPYAAPKLLRLNGADFETLKVYGDQNSATGTVLNKVVTDAIQLFPANKYGLVLWSHATGWLPPNSYQAISQMQGVDRHQDGLMVKSFGRESQQEMDIATLGASIPIKFDLIAFDACLMGGIEVYYQLRNKASYIIASPTDVLSTGFPYKEIVPNLFVGEDGYKEIAAEYMEFYQGQDGVFRSASISLVKTDRLPELANEILEYYKTNKIDKLPKDLDMQNIQRYDNLKTPVFVDLETYLAQLFNRDELEEIKTLLLEIVAYKDFTDHFIDIPLNKSSGMSTYASFGDDNLDNAYRKLDWYVDALDY